MIRGRARTIQSTQKSYNSTIYVITLLSKQPTSEMKLNLSRAIPVLFSLSLKPGEQNTTRRPDIGLLGGAVKQAAWQL